MYVCVCSVMPDSATLQTVACQAPLSMEFSRQEHWSGLPLPPPGDLPDPGIEPASPVSPALQADSLSSEPPGEPNLCIVDINSYLVLMSAIFNKLEKQYAQKWKILYIYIYTYKRIYTHIHIYVLSHV